MVMFFCFVLSVYISALDVTKFTIICGATNKGSIPLGRQFHTFVSTSYEGNSGLCGDPLPTKCGNSNAPSQLPSSSIEENDSGSGVELDWIFMLAGFGSGLVVGVVLANEGIKWRRKLFLEIVGMLIRLMKRIRRQRRN